MSTASEEEIAKIKLTKKKLRTEIDAKLSLLNKNEVVLQSKQVRDKLFVLTEFREAKRVGLYLSLPLEVDTTSILQECFRMNKQCFVPSYRIGTRQMDFVELHSMQDFEQLPVEPKWQIKQPNFDDKTRAEALATGGLDLLLVPGVAFTNDGLRLGHGKGYFDTWLERCFATSGIRHPTTVALALKQQIVDHLPVHHWDVRIDKVIAP